MCRVRIIQIAHSQVASKTMVIIEATFIIFRLQLRSLMHYFVFGRCCEEYTASHKETRSCVKVDISKMLLICVMLCMAANVISSFLNKFTSKYFFQCGKVGVDVSSVKGWVWAFPSKDGWVF